MRILIEEHQYQAEQIRDVLHGIDAMQDIYNNRRIKAKLKGLPPAIHRQQALSAA